MGVSIKPLTSHKKGNPNTMKIETALIIFYIFNLKIYLHYKICKDLELADCTTWPFSDLGQSFGSHQ